MDELTAGYFNMLGQFLPRGPAWSDKDRLLSGLAPSLSAAHERIDDLVKETDPRQTTELIDRWERICGLPDTCAPPGMQTLVQRQQRLDAKVNLAGGITENFYLATLAAIGYPDATITNYYDSIFLCTSDCTDSVYDEAWRYVWVVNFTEPTKVSEMVCVGECVDPLRYWGDTVAECVMNKLCASHTIVLFTYPDPAPLIYSGNYFVAPGTPAEFSFVYPGQKLTTVFTGAQIKIETPLNAALPVTYEWDNHDAISSIDESGLVTFQNSGEFNVSIKDAAGATWLFSMFPIYRIVGSNLSDLNYASANAWAQTVGGQLVMRRNLTLTLDDSARDEPQRGTGAAVAEWGNFTQNNAPWLQASNASSVTVDAVSETPNKHYCVDMKAGSVAESTDTFVNGMTIAFIKSPDAPPDVFIYSNNLQLFNSMSEKYIKANALQLLCNPVGKYIKANSMQMPSILDVKYISSNVAFYMCVI